MSYQSFMKQALNDVYANKQQQTQGYGQNYSQYGGSPLAGGYQPNIPTSSVNINYPQNPYSGQIGNQISPYSTALNNMPLSPNIGQPTPYTPNTGNKLNWGSSGSYNQTRDDIIANLGRPFQGPIGSGYQNQTRFDIMKRMMNSGKHPWTSLFDMYGIGNYDTYDEWKNAYMTEHPNNDVISTYQTQ